MQLQEACRGGHLVQLQQEDEAAAILWLPHTGTGRSDSALGAQGARVVYPPWLHEEVLSGIRYTVMSGGCPSMQPEGAISWPGWKGRAPLVGAECCRICSTEARSLLAFSRSPSPCKVRKVGGSFGVYL